jgi:NhaP-type Na+/H+ or K+/H+ antiporter
MSIVFILFMKQDSVHFFNLRALALNTKKMYSFLSLSFETIVFLFVYLSRRMHPVEQECMGEQSIGKGLVSALAVVAGEVARFIPAMYKQSEETQSYSSRSERRRDTFRNRRLVSWSFWSGRCFKTNDALLDTSGRTRLTTTYRRVLHRLCLLTWGAVA